MNSSALKGMAPSAVRETKLRSVLLKQMCPADTRRSSTSLYHCVYLLAMVASPAESLCEERVHVRLELVYCFPVVGY